MGTRQRPTTLIITFQSPMNLKVLDNLEASEDALPRKHQRPHTSPTGSTATEMKISVLLSL